MVNANNILTSFNDVNPPYVKLGSYDLPWKEGYYTYTTWIGIIYSRLRVGDSSSSYDEVYTGNDVLSPSLPVNRQWDSMWVILRSS